jgi:hypothetical protein
VLLEVFLDPAMLFQNRGNRLGGVHHFDHANVGGRGDGAVWSQFEIKVLCFPEFVEQKKNLNTELILPQVITIFVDEVVPFRLTVP